MQRIVAIAVGAIGAAAYFDSLMERDRATDVWLEDYDCYHVAQDPIQWNAIANITKYLPEQQWISALDPHINTFAPFVENDYALEMLAGECPAGTLFMLVVNVLPCRFHTHYGWTMDDENIRICEWFGRRISYLFGRVSIRVLAAVRFPIVKMLTSRTNFVERTGLGCHDAETTVIDWNNFREALWHGDWGDRFATHKDWFDNALDFVIDSRFDTEPKPLAQQCYLGVIFGFATKMTICASSESGCFYSYSKPVTVFLGTSPIDHFLNNDWSLQTLITIRRRYGFHSLVITKTLQKVQMQMMQ